MYRFLLALHAGPLTLDARRQRLTRGPETVPVPRRQMDLLPRPVVNAGWFSAIAQVNVRDYSRQLQNQSLEVGVSPTDAEVAIPQTGVGATMVRHDPRLRPGDAIIVANRDGTYDVLRVREDGQQGAWRAGFQTAEYAHAVACACLGVGGRVVLRRAGEPI